LAHYRIYLLGEDAHIKVAHDADSDDDAAAVLVAEELLSHTTYLSSEVWQGNKLVARIAVNGVGAGAASSPPANKVSPEIARH
jgi:hypothetical protein